MNENRQDTHVLKIGQLPDLDYTVLTHFVGDDAKEFFEWSKEQNVTFSYKNIEQIQDLLGKPIDSGDNTPYRPKSLPGVEKIDLYVLTGKDGVMFFNHTQGQYGNYLNLRTIMDK